MPALGRGVVTGIGKRPSADAPLPGTRLVLPAARIDAARVIRYARVCGFRETDPLPITYPHILGFPLAARLMGDRGFPLPLLGLVHTGIAITQHRPLSPADRPELTVYAAGLRPHHRGTEAEIVTEARLHGEPVWSDRSTYLARHRTGRRTDVPKPADSPESADSPEPREPLPVAARWDLGADLGRRHAAVSGDYNPIHLYPLTARLLGFRRAIAHGMWTFARCVAETGASSARNVTVRAEFRAPVLLPATVSYGRLGTDFELRGGRDGSRTHLRGRVTTDGDW
ncbi:hypothetical protein GCU69_01210 [Streptomyces lycii]|uniref:MaoC-like domain-containing protein n=2 Tax=Streptomyces lycii TaxID=2654337 RepID=A0ABQ7FPT2_9ACTN|nr:MaoC/PaaZ C-terminal domain-containing protein [Streptomyces lycii]KAF4410941.1 hypothetical protein GCU69_01210 [Streptomyces lycii]